MRGSKTFRNPRARAALIAAIGLLLGGGAGGVALAQSQQEPQYHSSIQVPNDKNEKGEQDEKGEKGEKGEENEQDEKGKSGSEADEANDPAERAESASYQHLARITADQARSAALTRVQGTVSSVTLENEDGNLVYGVSVKTAAGEQDVKVDAGNGKVLHIDKD